MPRPSKYEQVVSALRADLAAALTHPPEEYPLDVKSVAARLGVSRTSLYNYALVGEIAAAEQLQRDNKLLSRRDVERSGLASTIDQLRTQLVQAEERNKVLLGLINTIEHNAMRLGINAEELYRPLLKPLRQVSHAGRRSQSAANQNRSRR